MGTASCPRGAGAAEPLRGAVQTWPSSCARCSFPPPPSSWLPTHFIQKSSQPLLLSVGFGYNQAFRAPTPSALPHPLTPVPKQQEPLFPHLLSLAPLFAAPWSAPASPQRPQPRGASGAALPVGVRQLRASLGLHTEELLQARELLPASQPRAQQASDYSCSFLKATCTQFRLQLLLF